MRALGPASCVYFSAEILRRALIPPSAVLGSQGFLSWLV